MILLAVFHQDAHVGLARQAVEFLCGIARIMLRVIADLIQHRADVQDELFLHRDAVLGRKQLQLLDRVVRQAGRALDAGTCAFKQRIAVLCRRVCKDEPPPVDDCWLTNRRTLPATSFSCVLGKLAPLWFTSVIHEVRSASVSFSLSSSE